MKMRMENGSTAYWLPELKKDVVIKRGQEIDEDGKVGTLLKKYYAEDCILEGETKSGAEKLASGEVGNVTQADLDALVLESGNVTPEQAALIISNNEAIELLKENIIKNIGVPSEIEFVYGGNSGGGFWAYNKTATTNYDVESIELFIIGSGTVNIRTYTKSDTLYSKKTSIESIPVVAGKNILTTSQLGGLNILAGEFVAVQAVGCTLAYNNISYDNGMLNLGSNNTITSSISPITTIGMQFRVNYFTESQAVTATAFNTLKSRVDNINVDEGVLSLSSNLDKIVVISNSYNQFGAMKGKSPTCMISSLSDFNFANYSTNGATMDRNKEWIENDAAVRGDYFSWYRAKYGLIVENQNSKATQTDLQYFDSTQKLIDVLKARGIIPILMSEWSVPSQAGIPIDGEARNVRGLKALAERNNILFIDGTSKVRLLNPSSYTPFWRSEHPQTRTSWIVTDAFREVIDNMPIVRQSFKLFRTRNSVSSVNDLLYDTTDSRHRLFKELYTSHQCINDTDIVNYDTQQGTTTQAVVYDEYIKLEKGTSISLGVYSLLEVIIPVYSPTSIKLTIPDTGVSIYIRKKTNTGTIFTSIVAVDGIFNIPITALDYDKLSIVMYKSSGLTLSSSPIVSWTGGTNKPTDGFTKPMLTNSSEMLIAPFTVASSSIPSEWTNSGLTVVVPADSQLPTGSTGCVEVTSSSSISQIFSYASSDIGREVLVKVWARNWKPIFDNTSSFSSSLINYDSCDTSTLKCVISGASGITSSSSVFTYEVGLHWSEITFKCYLSPLTTSAMITINSETDAIQISKVSIKEL